MEVSLGHCGAVPMVNINPRCMFDVVHCHPSLISKHHSYAAAILHECIVISKHF